MNMNEERATVSVSIVVALASELVYYLRIASSLGTNRHEPAA